MNAIAHTTVAALLAACLCLVTGCEVEPTSQASITVTPNFAKMKEGQSLIFTASGWTDYRWSLSDKNIGVLDSTTGSSVTYTAIADSSASQNLTVTGRNAGTGTNVTDVTTVVVIQHELTNPETNTTASLLAY
jgi:hypothetical protein